MMRSTLFAAIRNFGFIETIAKIVEECFVRAVVIRTIRKQLGLKEVDGIEELELAMNILLHTSPAKSTVTKTLFEFVFEA